MSRQILKARFVLPMHGPAIENGAVAIEGKRITEVGPARALTGAETLDFQDAVILPALVNAHTHLELTNLAGAIPPTSDFADWLKRLVIARRADGPTQSAVERAVREGVAQSLRAGVTTVGDITSTPPWTRAALADAPLRSVSFGEVIAIGRRRAALADQIEAAASAHDVPDHVRVGISPHAPYTVEPDAMRACALRATGRKLPLCIHLAETRDEEEFTRTGDGPLVDLLRELGVWDDNIPVANASPTELLDRCGVLGPRTLLAHANYVSDSDLDRIQRSGASVVYCPRTHAAFRHQPHRFEQMLRRGINVCVGTDSLASNPSLSILEELWFLRAAHPGVSPTTLLEMGTLRGARALGFEDRVGSLTPGNDADCVVIPISREQASIGWHSVLEKGPAPIAVFCRGTKQSADLSRGL